MAACGDLVIIVALLIQAQLKPYLEEIKPSDGNATYRGYTKDLMDSLADDLGFEYDFVQPKDKVFGYRNEDGNWTGTINDIITGKADVIAGPLTATYLRSQFVEFSQPFQRTGAAIVLKNPEEIKEPIGERLTKIFQPFESSVWMLICMSFMVTGTVMYIISYLNPYEWRRMARDSEATLREGESFTCMNSFFFALSTLTWQGYTRAPRSIGGRTVALSWWMFAVIVISCYIANLSNMMRVGPAVAELSQYIQIKNLDDLANSDIPFAITRGGSMQQFFKTSKLETVRVLHDEMHKGRGKFVDSVEEGIQKVKDRDGQFAFVTEMKMAKHFIEKLSCQLYLIVDYTISRHYCLAFPKNASYIDGFNSRLLQMEEKGVLSELENKWFPGKCRNMYFGRRQYDKFKIPENSAMELGYFSGALLILAAGICSGGLISLAEYFIFRYAETDSEPKVNKFPPKEKTTGNEDLQLEATGALLPDKGKESTTVGILMKEEL